jgi:CheY-like chemotaxis protein/anti-sigma regulatory factor (Ser/Thr protein kinase)
VLEINGHECLAAQNGEEGLEVFDEFMPDVVLSDIQMPKMSGLDFLRAIRNDNSNAIVIMVTAYGSEDYAIKAFREGANNYLKKPIYEDDLLAMLAKYKPIISQRSEQEVIPSLVQQRSLTMKFGSDVHLIPKVVDYLITETGTMFTKDELINVELGLVELLMNAIEHGNLNISYQDKAKALETNSLQALYVHRLEEELYRSRCTSVFFNQNLSGCEWLITDEGEGFDFEDLPDPTANDNLLDMNGRGIFISKFMFDSLEYLGKGNMVRVKKESRKSLRADS